MERNTDLSKADWLDYLGMVLVLVGIIFFGIWITTQYAWESMVGKGDAWR